MSRRIDNDTILLGDWMYTSIDNGSINFKLKQILIDRNLSKNKLSVMSGVRFDTIQRFCLGNISRIDLEILCRLCNALNCKIEDIIEYKNK